MLGLVNRDVVPPTPPTWNVLSIFQFVCVCSGRTQASTSTIKERETAILLVCNRFSYSIGLAQ